jgi:hypothetical protein
MLTSITIMTRNKRGQWNNFNGWIFFQATFLKKEIILKDWSSQWKVAWNGKELWISVKIPSQSFPWSVIWGKLLFLFEPIFPNP